VIIIASFGPLYLSKIFLLFYFIILFKSADTTYVLSERKPFTGVVTFINIYQPYSTSFQTFDHRKMTFVLGVMFSGSVTSIFYEEGLHPLSSCPSRVSCYECTLRKELSHCVPLFLKCFNVNRQ